MSAKRLCADCYTVRIYIPLLGINQLLADTLLLSYLAQYSVYDGNFKQQISRITKATKALNVFVKSPCSSHKLQSSKFYIQYE